MISEFGLQEIERVIWQRKQASRLLEANTLLLGATQTGKSTLLDMLIGWVAEEKKGKSVIFEVKGDRIVSITQEDFFVTCSQLELSNGKEFVWSILKEAVSSGRSVERRIAEIYEPFFSAKAQKSSQPYFITAACNLLTGLTYSLYLKYGIISNCKLFHLMEEMDVGGYLALMTEVGTVKKYARDIPIINGKMTGQAAGVLGELSHYIRLFSSIFIKEGTDSIYEFCVSEHSERLYLLYDYMSCEKCDFLMTLLLNLIISYKLSYISVGNENIYLFLDEISVIENSEINFQYAANIGTSKGIYLFVAVQSISLLEAVYGSDSTCALLDGFSNIVAFKVNQQETKEFIKNRVGMEVDSLIVSMPVSRKDKASYQVRRGNIITDKLLESLEIGTAVVKLGINRTGIIHFKKEG